FHDFEKDKMRRFAVERQLLVIGEAANHLSEGFMKESAHIPWEKIIGLRNIIAHEYGEILVERIWITALNHIQELHNNVKMFID
ncbi:MAG: HepT-like ribonuclease domain-containing protein, partial [Candidatus Cloacimonadota bacterium]|nr:HepT-like ribonuclease domain-containing protein [Candidatus Cloacimonadota bacterium]